VVCAVTTPRVTAGCRLHSATLETDMRWCADIGMFAIDRPMASCKHATRFCRKHCYNWKFFRTYPHTMRPHEKALAREWKELTGEGLRLQLSRKKNQTARLRMATRGEPLATLADVVKVESLARANPRTAFWVPTRAWRDSAVGGFADVVLGNLPNVRLMASVDPTTSAEDWEVVRELGWKPMFFGRDNLETTPIGGVFRCPKTWAGAKAHCATCGAGGCFDANSPTTTVLLRKH
jgi:hypothetical protein